MCRSRRELSNTCLLAKFRFDTAPRTSPVKFAASRDTAAIPALAGGASMVTSFCSPGVATRRDLGWAFEKCIFEKCIFRKCIFRKCVFRKFCKFLAGSFSAVSKRNFARKYAFDSIFQALQDLHPLHRCNLKIFAKNRFEKTAIFVKFQQKKLQMSQNLQIFVKFQRFQLENLVDFEK